MSESAKTIIKYFCDRFLNLDYYPSNLKSILDLELEKLKGINDKETKKFNKIGIVYLRDLSKLESYKFEDLAKNLKIEKSILKNALIASNLISNAWNKRNQYLKKPKLKVVVAGLDFAGKTSLLNRLINDYNYNDMANLEPTKGANVEEYQSERVDLILWDLGGQIDHLDEYLTSPEKFFVQVDILIFVIDSQDDNRYLSSIKYLSDITNTLEFLKENPFILVLLNKADFDLRDDPDFQIKLEYLADKISTLIKSNEKSWNFEIIPTSIYNYYSNEPEIVKSIKNIFSKEKEQPINEILIPDIDEKIQKILDLNLKLMDKFVSELTEIKRVLQKLTPASISDTLFSVPFQKVKQDFVSQNSVTGKNEKKKGKKGKTDDSQKKKKKDKALGPPRPLSSHPVKELEKQTMILDDKVTKEKLETIKSSLKAPTQIPGNLSNPPSAPLIASNHDKIDKNTLKPPPRTSNIPYNDKFRDGSPRTQILSELKEMFLKRGLVDRNDV